MLYDVIQLTHRSGTKEPHLAVGECQRAAQHAGNTMWPWGAWQAMGHFRWYLCLRRQCGLLPGSGRREIPALGTATFGVVDMCMSLACQLDFQGRKLLGVMPEGVEM